jgi:hypothetical protein
MGLPGIALAVSSRRSATKNRPEPHQGGFASLAVSLTIRSRDLCSEAPEMPPKTNESCLPVAVSSRQPNQVKLKGAVGYPADGAFTFELKGSLFEDKATGIGFAGGPAAAVLNTSAKCAARAGSSRCSIAVLLPGAIAATSGICIYARQLKFIQKAFA